MLLPAGVSLLLTSLHRSKLLAVRLHSPFDAIITMVWPPKSDKPASHIFCMSSGRIALCLIDAYNGGPDVCNSFAKPKLDTGASGLRH